MKQVYLILFLLLMSCGARKVEKSKEHEKVNTKEKIVVENDITATDNIKIESKSFVIDSTKEEIEEIEISPIDILKPAYYENKELKNTKLVKRKIKRNKAIKSENNTNTSYDSKTLDKTKKTGEKAKQSETNKQTKSVDQKQFNPIALIIQYWWLWLLIALILWLLKKYKDKMTFI